MNTWDAVGFVVLGQVMLFAPGWFPGYFPPGVLDGDNTSALWLQVMGFCNSCIGLGLLASAASVAAGRLFAARIPEDALLPLQAEGFTVVFGLYAEPTLSLEERRAA